MPSRRVRPRPACSSASPSPRSGKPRSPRQCPSAVAATGGRPRAPPSFSPPRRHHPALGSYLLPTAARPLADSAAKELNMAARSENERNKAVVDEFYKAGIQGHLTRFVQYLHPDFTWTAPNYLPWGGTHTGAPLFRDQVLSRLPDVFDFTRFSYDNVVAEDGHVVAVIKMGVTGTHAIIKIADHLTGRDGHGPPVWVAYFRPQAPLGELRHR